MIAGLITNGYFLVPKRIEGLNHAGLDFLQISIDNVEPDEVSKKSLRRARQEAAAPRGARRLRRQHQLGRSAAASRTPRTRASSTRARARARLLDLDRHHPRRLGPAEAARAGGTQGVRRGLGSHQRPVAGLQEPLFGDSRTSRTTSPTASRTTGAAAPARAISTSARTAWCTTARSSAATRACRSSPTRLDDIRREFATPKPCAPFCTVGCVHRVSTMDFWRSPQRQDAPALQPVRPARLKA